MKQLQVELKFTLNFKVEMKFTWDFQVEMIITLNFEVEMKFTWKFFLKGCLTSSPCPTLCHTCPGTEREVMRQSCHFREEKPGSRSELRGKEKR